MRDLLHPPDYGINFKILSVCAHTDGLTRRRTGYRGHKKRKAFLLTLVPLFAFSTCTSILENSTLAFLPTKVKIESSLQAKYKHGFIWLIQCLKYGNIQVILDN